MKMTMGKRALEERGYGERIATHAGARTGGLRAQGCFAPGTWNPCHYIPTFPTYMRALAIIQTSPNQVDNLYNHCLNFT